VKTFNYYYLEEEQQWLGYLPDYPDYWEEAESFEQLQTNLCHLHFDFTLLKALKTA
jgi:predicted RNase H-like HicB family nuclease